MSQSYVLEISDSLHRAIQINLTRMFVPLVRLHVPDQTVLFIYLIITAILFRFINFPVLYTIVITMSVRILFDSVDSSLSSFYVLTVTFVFVCSTIVQSFHSDVVERITGNIQYLYATSLQKLTVSYTGNQWVSIALLFTATSVNTEFRDVLSMAAIRIIQDTIIAAIPLIIVIPASVSLVYVIHALAAISPITVTVSDFATFNAANIIVEQIKPHTGSGLAALVTAAAAALARYNNFPKTEEVLKIACVAATAQLSLQYLTSVAYNDPVIAFVPLIYILQVFRRLFSDNMPENSV